MAPISFTFLDPGTLTVGELSLVLAETKPWIVSADGGERVPAYVFDMRAIGVVERVGTINLRIGSTEGIRLYAGNIGYTVFEQHRGHRYAARACKLLMPLARRHGLRELWITCNPDNIASRRTCELAGARFVEIVNLPAEGEMYQRGERRKCRYRLELI